VRNSIIVRRLQKKKVFNEVKEITNTEAAAIIDKNSMGYVDPRNSRMGYWMKALGFRLEKRPHEGNATRKYGG
jgi:hypothetical protein